MVKNTGGTTAGYPSARKAMVSHVRSSLCVPCAASVMSCVPFQR
jgi:hypothetical protein